MQRLGRVSVGRQGWNGKGAFELLLLVGLCQDYHFCHFIITMKTHAAYSSEQIQKYLKFKKTSTIAPNPPKEEPISSPVSTPPAKSSAPITIPPEMPPFRSEVESDPGKGKSAMDKIALIKQRYLKKYRDDGPSLSNIAKNLEEMQRPAQTVTNSHQSAEAGKEKKADCQPLKLPVLQLEKEKKQGPLPDKPVRNCQGSSIVHHIILKRFNQVLHSSHSTSIATSDQDEEDASQAGKMVHRSTDDKLSAAKRQQDMCLDEQYIDQIESNDFNQPIQTKERSLQQKILLWLHSPANLISQTLPNASLQSPPAPFIFHSSNKGYNSAIAVMIHSFMLDSKGELTQGQRRALYHLAFEYFYRNASELTAQLLIVLIKLGRRYLQQNVQFFTHNLQNYCTTILNNRALFTLDERVNIVNFLLQQGNIGQKQIGCLILVQPTQRLIQRLSSKVHSMHEAIFLLACVTLSRRQFAQLGEVELRLICTLCTALSGQKELLEEMLAHVKEMAVGEGLYQLHKQARLKLIQMLSDEQRDVKVDQPERTSSKLIGYWSKAVDKIKSATTAQQH